MTLRSSHSRRAPLSCPLDPRATAKESFSPVVDELALLVRMVTVPLQRFGHVFEGAARMGGTRSAAMTF